MPTTRRKQANSSATSSQARSQSTLSFNAKSTRVTKPTVTDQSSKKPSSKLSEPAEAQVVEVASEPEQPAPEAEVEIELEVPIRESPAKPKPKPRSKKALSKNERETAAEKVTDAQLRKYWKAEEDARLAPRVHQSAVSLHEKILRHFDLSSQYGPCIGISRLARWKRANGLGLDPPVEVLAVLLREEDAKKSQGCGKLAYIDELSTSIGSGRGLLVE